MRAPPPPLSPPDDMGRTALALVLLLQPLAAWAARAEEGAPQDGKTRTRLLREATRGCDALLVGDPLEPGATVHDAAAIEALLAGIEIDGVRSGWICRCVGEPCLTFVREDHIRVALSIHHGIALSWGDGPWAGNSELTAKSQWFLCEWLAQRGCKRPLEELESAEVLRLREVRYEAILPSSTWSALKDRRTLEDALGCTVPTRLERLRLLLRMYGCHAGPWSTYAGRDREIRDLVEDAPRETLLGLLADDDEDPDLLHGLARIFFEDRRSQPGCLPDRAADLRRIGRHALADPRRENRRRAMARLASGASPTAIALLREVLAGTLPPRPLPAAWAVDPLGDHREGGRSAEVDRVDSDRVAAAWLLANLDDQESREAVKRLVVGTKDPTDLDVVRRAFLRLTR